MEYDTKEEVRKSISDMIEVARHYVQIRNKITHGYSPESIPTLIDQWKKLSEVSKVEPQLPEWQEVKKAYSKHLQWRYSYPQQVYNLQLISQRVILILLFFLVVGGLGFSIFQLFKATQFGDISGLETDVAIEAAGRLSISTSVVGAVVLVLSLVFFYLYLRYVYKIQAPIPPHVSLKDTDIFDIQDLTQSEREEVEE
jgi:hypothetical protein